MIASNVYNLYVFELERKILLYSAAMSDQKFYVDNFFYHGQGLLVTVRLQKSTISIYKLPQLELVDTITVSSFFRKEIFSAQKLCHSKIIVFLRGNLVY